MAPAEGQLHFRLVEEVEFTSTECGRSALHVATRHVCGGVRVDSIRTARTMIEACTAAPLSRLIHIPLSVRLLSWSLLLKPSVSLRSLRSFIVCSRGKTALIHHVSALQIYNLSVPWSHFVVELYEHGKRVDYVDPFSQHIHLEYPDHAYDSSPPDEARLMHMVGTKILLFQS